MSRLRRAVVQVLMQPVRARGVALPIDLRDELREAYYAEPAEDALRAQLAEAREVLRSVEWAGHIGQGYYGCPECKADERTTHAPDCRLAKVLGEGR